MTCCEDLGCAIIDGVATEHPNLGVCLVSRVDAEGKLLDDPALIPIGYCPWCGQPTPTKLYKSPAMVYRP